MEYLLRKRTEEDIEEFLSWTYDDMYSFYDNSIQQEKIDGFRQSVQKERELSVVNECEELVGNCEFFDVSDEDEAEILAVGIQMKPSLTGKGHGSAFFHAIVEQGRSLFHYHHLELAVVDFNHRAIKVYKREGFQQVGEFMNDIRGESYRFIIMAKDWE